MQKRLGTTSLKEGDTQLLTYFSHEEWGIDPNLEKASILSLSLSRDPLSGEGGALVTGEFQEVGS